MRIRSLLAVCLVLVASTACAVDVDESNEPVADVQQTTGTCGQNFTCPISNGTGRLQRVRDNCSDATHTTSIDCGYSNNTTITLTPPSSSCNVCTIDVSVGPTQNYCSAGGGWVSTSFATINCTQ